ncbi:MAG TPA: hypothetical protein VFJ74_08125 [Gemmatimonadaceae bacterium]|nr:hypothetical protein [Gemmatimonadaceae bacterium]
MSPTRPAPGARRGIPAGAVPSVSEETRRAIMAREGTMLERPTRPLVDVSTLPTVVFGSRGHVWWGTMGFIVVESVTLAVCVASYLYLMRNFDNWPPLRTPRPSLVAPTIGLVTLLAAIVPTRLYHRASERLDRAATQRWLWVATLLVTAAMIIRVFEFFALGVRWDLNAYASAAWAIVFAHFTLLVVNAFETGTIALIFSMGRYEMKHFPDASDNAGYFYFMALSWVPLWVIVYLLPRWV